MSSRRVYKAKVTYGNRSKRMKDKQIVQIGGRVKLGATGENSMTGAAWTHLWRVLTPTVVCPLTLKGIRWDLQITQPKYPAYTGPQTINFRWALLACKASESLPSTSWDNPNTDIIANSGFSNNPSAPLTVTTGRYLFRPEEKVITHGVGSIVYAGDDAGGGSGSPTFHTSGSTKGMRKLMIGDFFVFVFSFIGDVAATGDGSTAGFNVLGNIQWVDLQ